MIKKIKNNDYEFVPAGSVSFTLGGVGSAGDIIERILIIPSDTSPGIIILQDSSSGGPFFIFNGGTLTDLTPLVVDVGFKSRDGAWIISMTGDHDAVAIGQFT